MHCVITAKLENFSKQRHRNISIIQKTQSQCLDKSSIDLSPDTRRWPPESWSVLEVDRDIPAAAAAAAAAFDSGRAVLDSGRASESAVDLLQVWGQCSVQYWLPVHSEWSQPSVW